MAILPANFANAYGSKYFNRNAKNYNVKLQIFDETQIIAEFFVSIANNQEKRNYGLMNLPKLEAKMGMLFIFERPDVINMWMKDTLIPLDMIFVDASNNIVNIKQMAAVRSLDIISSGKIIDKVLEINGGLCAKLGIKIGQKITYENFSNQR